MVYIGVKPNVTRLGNWLFQYAAAKTFAKGGEVAFVIKDSAWWPAVEKCRAAMPDVKIVDRAPEGVEVLEGLFQDVKFLDEGIVGKLFPLRNRFAGRIPAGTVSIHVRRGDYLKIPQNHPFVGENYLRKAVASFPKETEFLVFSDDISWCRKFFKGTHFHFSEGRDVIDDLFLMSWCDHHICSNSTYSWWGAYLGRRGRVIFPSMWYGMALRHLDCRGLYFPGVEVIPNHYTVGRWLMAECLMFKRRIGDVLRRLGFRKPRHPCESGKERELPLVDNLRDVEELRRRECFFARKFSANPGDLPWIRELVRKVCAK